MNDEAREAAVAERERIAQLADRCNATYELKFERAWFAALIRSGASAPPWWNGDAPDPLTANQGDGSA